MERLPESCTEVQAALPLYAGGDLDPREMDAVRTHVEGCPRCEVRAQRARTARARLATLRAEEPTVDLWPGIRAQLEAEGWLTTEGRPAPVPRPRALRPAPLWRRGALAAAAAAAALLAVSQLLSPPTVEDGGAGAQVTAPARAIAATPVSAPSAGRLRRLAPEEGHLLEGARPFTPEELFVPSDARDGANLASDLRRSGPLRLRRVR